MNAKEKKTDEPRMDQPSREAMAGKLQIYADGFIVERCLACEADVLSLSQTAGWPRTTNHQSHL